MLSEKIVSCGKCGQKLKIPNKNNEAARHIQCPVCHNGIFVSFIEEATIESETVYGPAPIPGDNVNSSSCPYLFYNGMKHFLEKEVMVIGRKAQTSTADIQIATSDMYMGRHHAVITKIGNDTCTLKAKDAKNGLSVNDIALGANDEVNLLDGAEIKMGNTKMVFRK